MAAKFTNRFEFERDLWSREFMLVAGVDEAGRGPLAGPVVAAVIFHFNPALEACPQLPRLQP